MATAASPISNALTNPYNLASNVDQSNLAASPYMSQLSTLINSLNQSAQQTANMSRIPGEAGLEQQSSNDISAELAGQLNPGTVSMIQDSMAQLYGGNGFGADNAATSAAAERAMGLTAEGQVQAGQSNLSAAAARNPAAPIYDASGLLVTPKEYLAALNAAASGSGSGSAASPTAGRSTFGGGSGSANPTQGTQNFGGATGGTYTTPTAATTTGTGAYAYDPGGSSVFGLIDTGDGNTLDMFDSSGLYSSGIMPQYGSMPDYSNPNVYAQNPASDPSMLNNFGQGATYTPPNTTYNPGTNTYDYTYGLGSYDTSPNTGWDIGSAGGQYPANTAYNPNTDSSVSTDYSGWDLGWD
jgi:hypothetical protein